MSGFTLVELLIVIVVIAILAAIAMVSYNGIQTRAQNAKIAADTNQIEKAIIAAEQSQAQPLGTVFGNNGGYGCGNGGEAPCCLNNNYTSITTATAAPQCWQSWNSFVGVIQKTAGINLGGMLDPWGQPYIIMMQESSTNCAQDQIWAVKPPFAGWGTARVGTVTLPFSGFSGCS